MGQLAASIKNQFDRLVEAFERNLDAVPFYAAVPAEARQNLARAYLNLAVTCLEAQDVTPLVQFLQARSRDVLMHGVASESLLQAVGAFEDVIWPLVNSLDDARFFGYAVSKSREAVSLEIASMLSASEQKFRQVVERSPVGIFGVTPDGQMIQVNPAFLHIVGYDSLEAINQVGLKSLYYDPADHQRLLDLLVEGPVSDFETAFCQLGGGIDRQGQIVLVSVNASLISSPEGQVVEGIIQDVSERRQAAERAQRRLTHLRAVTELTALLSAEHDADTLCRLAVELGREHLDVDRMSIWLNDGSPGSFRGTFGTDEQGQTRDEREARMETGQDSTFGQIALGTLPEAVTYESLRDHQGNVVGEGWHIAVPVEGAGGDVLGVLVADRLLTQRAWDDYIVEILRLYGLSVGRLLEGVSMLEALSSSQQMLRLIMDNIPQSVFWKDQNLNYLGCNRAYAQGRRFSSPDDVVGKSDFDLSPRAQAERFRADDRQVIESGQPKLDYEEPRITPDGAQRWLRTSKIPVKDAEGQVVAVLAMYEDITERRQMEQETQRRLRETMLLNRVMTATASAMEPNAVLETICRELAQAFDLPQAGVALLRDDDTILEVVAHYRASDESPALGMRISVVDNPASQYVIENRAPLAISDVQDDERERGFREAAQTLGIESMLLVPLVVRDRVIGTLGLDSFTPHEFTAEEIALAQSTAAVASQTLQSARLYEETQQSQQMLRLIIDTIPEMIFWKDRQSVYLGSNTRFAQASGVGTPADIIGLTDSDLAWTREEAGVFLADDREVIESAMPKLHIVKPQLRADGRRVWLETNKVPLFDAKNNVVGILGTAIDVTERMEALEAVRASQQMLQSVIDNIPQTVFWKDRNLVFLGCNAAFARDARLDSPAEIVGKTDYDLWWADMADKFRADDRAILETGEAIVSEENVRVFEDGRRGWSSQNKIPLRDENGQVWAMLGTSEDITERKLGEIALQENETRMALALEAADAGVWELHPQTMETYFDSRWFALLGYEPGELPQSYATWVGLLHPEEQEAVQAQVIHHIQQGADFALDFRMKAKEGGYRWIHAIGKMVEKNEDGSAAHIIGTHTDITDRVLRDRERIEMYVRRTEEVRISTQVAQEIAVATSLNDLLGRVVTLIKERFGYYHTQIFRHDPQQDAMVLVAGYGEVGARMLAAGHILPRGTGVVGMAAETGQPALAANASVDPNWQPNPNLPDTRGELAVPIRWRDQILGILDVQSNQVGELTDDDQLVLEGLCGQIAIAIRNAETLEEARTFRRLVEGTSQGIEIGTLDGRISYSNPAMIRMVGETDDISSMGTLFMTYYDAQEQQRMEKEIVPATMRDGEWQGEINMRSRTGQVIPTIHNLFLLRDEMGQPRHIVNIVTDITESKRSQAEMQERLQELNSLYRTISEEGWQNFREFAVLPGGYLYDGTEPRRADDLWLPEVGEAVTTGEMIVTTFEQPAAVAPLSVPGGEIVGALGVYDDPDHPLPPEDLNLMELVANEVAQALESARLTQETRAALAETGALYQTSQALNTANTLDDVLHAIRQGVELPTLHMISLTLFDRPWSGDDGPEYIITSATWNARGDASSDQVGSRYEISAFPILKLLRFDAPLVLGNVETDPTVDEATRSLFLDEFGARSVVFLPLVVAGQWIGFVDVYQDQPFEFREAHLRRLMALVGQAAVAVQSIRRLQETQTRAQREQQLRAITDRVRRGADVAAIVRATVEELSPLLKADELVLRLGTGQSLLPKSDKK
ncbi:MAG: PAS domain S-box protein [Anaerolineae bacterium]|nr:PAS domain S-box protein [Anaerolineae bacterium]